MISLDDITVAYGSYVLLDKVNFHISDSEKIGLVGRNGAGKSTLLKLICGLQSPTSGQVDLPKGITIGYLPQIMEHHRGRSVLEEVMTVFDEMKEIESRIADITDSLALRTDYESSEYAALIEELSELNDRLAVSHSEPPEVQSRRILAGLGFKDEELGRPTETFSQGWNMRIELAKILLRKPQVLLLDEPTNHLDILSIEWLEAYLKASRSALLMVSHDRRFLDNVTTRTIELMLGRINDYKVPYSQYLELRADRLAQQNAAYENQQRMIQKTEAFIQAFRYKPTKSNQVQSRIKALDKLERIEVDETDNTSLRVKFPPASRTGDVVFKAVDLTAGYPGKTVFSGADIEIKRGEKVAFVGRNGEGKTTLMRIISGELQPLAGEAKVGHNVNLGYYAQNQEDILDNSLTVYETLEHIATGEMRSRLRDLLAQFLFRGADIDKKVSVLSGGERARLGMAKLMLRSHNVLALDEPTNHMDIKSKDILREALKAFDGTLMVVSHDRDFLEGLVDKVYEFGDGRVREHLGGISDFLERKRLESLQELERGAAAKVEVAAPKGAQDFSVMKAKSKEQKKKESRIAWLESEIGKLEGKMAEIEKILSAPGEGDDIMELTRSYLELKRDLDPLTEEWGSLIEGM